jgi:hypothetical protein
MHIELTGLQGREGNAFHLTSSGGAYDSHYPFEPAIQPAIRPHLDPRLLLHPSTHATRANGRGLTRHTCLIPPKRKTPEVKKRRKEAQRGLLAWLQFDLVHVCG